ncbi:MAG: hypothetical protein NXI31_06860 [bacterium]|nr:hypothetical protein [bacterium]
MNDRSRRCRLPLAVFLLPFCLALLPAQGQQGSTIGFPEDWALTADRSELLTKLIPGTEVWYYYCCRDALDRRDYAGVRDLLKKWIQRHGRSSQVREIEHREALLSYADDSERTYRHLRETLGVRFDHQRSAPGEKSDLPTRLDPELLSPSRLANIAFKRKRGTVDGFEDRALPTLLATELDSDRLHSALKRLRRPDVANLPALVVRDLGRRRSRGFGSLEIHFLLRRSQLEECVRLRPALLNDPKFVQALLTRLMPRSDVAWQRDPAAREAQLLRLWQFAQRLAPAHNSLKAHVLYHWLAHDLTLGKVDRERFLTYIRLPRRQSYVARTYLERQQKRRVPFIDYGTKYPTGMPAIGNDKTLVRDCLEHIFATEDSYTAYAEFLDQRWLRNVLAETKILLGQGDMEKWYSLLDDPQRLEALEKRVELRFPPTQRTQFAAAAPVAITVETKNVPTLLVKVFQIDSYRYHTERQREVDATIELDGLVANHEKTYEYDEPALRRVSRQFDLPMLREPGTYVVEFVGNGISSRAVIHKGSLRHTERVMAAGHEFRVFDETGKPQRKATLWFGGREYEADEDGSLVVPFSTKGGDKPAVLRVGNRSQIIRFHHRTERFELACPAFVEREALVAGNTAQLALRPELRLNGNRVALAMLEEPVITIHATDVNGTKRTEELRDAELKNDREFVHAFQVPRDLQEVQVTLRGKVTDVAGKKVELAARPATIAVNGIDTTANTFATMLVPVGPGYAIELRGKNGEPITGRPCNVRLKHEDYTSEIKVNLQTNERGRIDLGRLGDINYVIANPTGGMQSFFTLGSALAKLPHVMHGQAGETLRLPYTGKSTSVSRAEFSLLADDEDAFNNLALADGFLELRDLPAGDYTLHLHEHGEMIPVRVTQGAREGDWILGRSRTLEATSTTPLHVRQIGLDGDDLRIALTNFSAGTRVHVVATRYQPAYPLFAGLDDDSRNGGLFMAVDPLTSSYQAGRRLSDEYRYVLERRFATKFAGNMLQRPSLLLNPWALERDSWNSAVGLGGGAGGKYGGRGGRPRSSAAGGPSAAGPSTGMDFGRFANLDYLPVGAKTHFNLTPDDNGIVRIAATDLGEGQVVHVLALDGNEAIYDRLMLDERPLTPRSRALAASLPTTEHFVEQKRIEFVTAGGEAVVGEAHSAQVEVFDSLRGVFDLMATISRNGDLRRFAFVLEWPQLTDDKKRELYSQHACHELHFFVYQKDREFFDAVIRPFLRQKMHKTFLDHWLLGNDLRHYLDPWRFAQLNLVEQILLAQRLDGAERQAVGRLVQEQFELVPVQRERFAELFRTALAANELQPEANKAILGFAAMSQSLERAKEAAPKPRAGGPTTPGAPAADKRVRAKAPRREVLADEDEQPEAETGSDDFFLGARRAETRSADRKLRKQLERRKNTRQLFRGVEPTKLLVESNYWRRPMEATTNDLVQPGQFWVDYATAPSNRPFVSPAFLQVGASFLEMMFALSVLDLPFDAGKHDVAIDGQRRTLRAATPLLLVRKEVTGATSADDEPPLLIGENLFRLDERWIYQNGQKREKFVTDEFLTSVAYGAQVVVSNPTGQQRTVDVLMQIPAGALPLNAGFLTKSRPIDLAPYETKAVEYAFYFPAAGEFSHYPAHAATQGRLVAAANPRTLNVVTTPSRVDTRSWEHVSQQGSSREVIDYLDSNNVRRLDLSRIAWRMRDREFFHAATAKLRARYAFEPTLWSYGLLHRDEAATREYLRHCKDFLDECGPVLNSPLVTIDPVERRRFQHIEFSPLVHARAHRLGSQHVIGNRDLAQQYRELLHVLGYHRPLQSADWLQVTYYLLLQDRIEDALAAHERIVPTQLDTRVQYDYLSAYLCFFTATTAQARTIAERHRDHPVTHWRKRFREILAHLDEAEGKTAPTADPQSGDALAATAPAIELTLEGRTARIAHKNLASCEVRYYELDVEFAFSSQPFASTSGTTAAYVKPNLREVRELPADKDGVTFDLPAQFQSKNVLVEVRGGGLVRSRTYFANALDVRFLETFGQVAVSDPKAGRPLPKTYVKVFARLPNGQIRFHKDGYTDLRGRFDYASLSDDPNAGANRYAVLVLSDDLGAVIRDVAPPMQ